MTKQAPHADKSFSDLALLRRLMVLMRPYWLNIGGLLLLSLAATPLALLQPVPIKIAVDSAIGGLPLPGFIEAILPGDAPRSRQAALIIAVVLVVVVAMLNQLRNIATGLVRVYTGQLLLMRFRARLFRHLQRLSLAYHDSRGAADSIYRIQSDAPAIQKLAVDGLIPLVSAGATLLAMFYVVARLQWQFVTVALATAPLLGVVSYFRRRSLRPRYRSVKALESSAQSVIHEVLGALRIVKSFAQEDRETERYANRSTETKRAQIQIVIVENVFGTLSTLTTSTGRAVVLFIGVFYVQQGALTLGDLVLILSYLTQLYGPLNTLTNKPAQMQSNLASAERVFALLDERPDVVEQADARPLRKARGAISFQDVSFGYGADRTILDGVSFDVIPGNRVGIVGPTGSGKTTLVSLLSRFYDPTHGRILLDGVDLREYRLDDLRHQFAIVLQDAVLFSVSIAENIAYGRPEAEEGDIIAAAKAANAHDFISKLPNGYESLVGERGMQLSGGERQRISIARAFLKNAPILILDEPTSSVDVNTERAIMDAMGRLMEGRTSFMITHRTSTLIGLDILLQIEDGRLVPTEAAVGG